MIPFPRVVIVGLGLIGGSWALGLRRTGFEGEIVAYDPAASARAAVNVGAVNVLRPGPWRAADCRPGDLVVLATPVATTVELLRGPARRLPAGVVLTDVGSTKRAVCAAWQEQPGPTGVDFIGGHPMAGSHRTGFPAARGDLFDGAAYFLVAEDFLVAEHGTALDNVTAVVQALGARAVVVDAGAHDRAVAVTSHLPQLLATVLGAVIADSDVPVVPGPGLVSMTRLAASPWSVWRDTLHSNRDEITRPLTEVIAALEEVRCALAAGDLRSVERLFARAASYAEPVLDLGARRG